MKIMFEVETEEKMDNGWPYESVISVSIVDGDKRTKLSKDEKGWHGEFGTPNWTIDVMNCSD